MLKAFEVKNRLLKKLDEVIGLVSLKGKGPSARLTRLKGVVARAATKCTCWWDQLESKSELA